VFGSISFVEIPRKSVCIFGEVDMDKNSAIYKKQAIALANRLSQEQLL
jgi:hypothetical protein